MHVAIDTGHLVTDDSNAAPACSAVCCGRWPGPTGSLLEGRHHFGVWVLLSAGHLGKDVNLQCGI